MTAKPLKMITPNVPVRADDDHSIGMVHHHSDITKSASDASFAPSRPVFRTKKAPAVARASKLDRELPAIRTLLK